IPGHTALIRRRAGSSTVPMTTGRSPPSAFMAIRTLALPAMLWHRPQPMHNPCATMVSSRWTSPLMLPPLEFHRPHETDGQWPERIAFLDEIDGGLRNYLGIVQQILRVEAYREASAAKAHTAVEHVISGLVIGRISGAEGTM